MELEFENCYNWTQIYGSATWPPFPQNSRSRPTEEQERCGRLVTRFWSFLRELTKLSFQDERAKKLTLGLE